jgi:hypothetical protein
VFEFPALPVVRIDWERLEQLRASVLCKTAEFWTQRSKKSCRRHWITLAVFRTRSPFFKTAEFLKPEKLSPSLQHFDSHFQHLGLAKRCSFQF